MAKNELNVTWEDQKRINDFSVLVNQCDCKSEQLATLARKLQAGKDAIRELEMVLDEDELVQLKNGNGFFNMKHDDITARVSDENESLQKQIIEIKADLARDEERSLTLKKVLHSKFGDSIQLEL